jgi:hypothetical protein
MTLNLFQGNTGENELAHKISTELSTNIEMSHLVEKRGGKSKHFEEDLIPNNLS